MATVRILALLASAAIISTPSFADGQEAPSESKTAATQCIDQDLADRLAVKRKRRGRSKRHFIKAQRHELSALGGYYAADLLSATYIVGGSYAYHMTENTAVEASVTYTHANAELIRSIEGGRATVIDDEFAPVVFASAALLWYPLHGKLRFGGTILHFDMHVDLGVGVVDSDTSRGAAGIVGFGFKFFTGDAIAFRIDARDYIYQQELLDETFIVNDISITAGVSVYLPLRF